MRVLFCKIHCPFICFSKSSATHIYTPEPLKLENNPNDPVTSIPISNDSSDQSDKSSPEVKEEDDPVTLIPISDDSSDQSGKSSPEVKEEDVNGNQETVDAILKSCIRKIDSDEKEIVKKKVKWIDSFGEELVEIKEFESSDTGDTDSEEGNSCVCTIL